MLRRGMVPVKAGPPHPRSQGNSRKRSCAGGHFILMDSGAIYRWLETSSPPLSLGYKMTRRHTNRFLAVFSILVLMALDHLPAETPEMLLASLSGDSQAAASEWDALPIMYD